MQVEAMVEFVVLADDSNIRQEACDQPRVASSLSPISLRCESAVEHDALLFGMLPANPGPAYVRRVASAGSIPMQHFYVFPSPVAAGE